MTTIGIPEQIGEILPGITVQEIVFRNTFSMKTPGILHLGQSAIIQTNPPIKYAGHDLEQENNHQLWMTQPRGIKKFHPCHQPGKKNEIGNKEEVLQGGGVCGAK